MNVIKKMKMKRDLKKSAEKVCAAFGHYTYVKGKGEVPCGHRRKK